MSWKRPTGVRSGTPIEAKSTLTRPLVFKPHECLSRTSRVKPRYKCVDLLPECHGQP